MTYNYQIFQLDAHKPELLAKKYHNYGDIVAKYGKVNFSEYTKTYEGVLQIPTKDKYQVLDRLFEKFNINHPEDFHGHSLSVGDIVEIDGVKFYCDSLGWKQL